MHSNNRPRGKLIHVDTQDPYLSLPEAPDEDFATLLKENDRDRAAAVDRSGGSKQIDATVIAVTADMVFLDIGYKTEGILPLGTFADTPPEVGDKLRVAVKGRDLDGYYELTRQRSTGPAAPKDYSSLEEAFEAGGTVPGTVTGVVKGGLTVDIGMRAFLPFSRSGTRDNEEAEKLVGQEIRVRITTLDLEGGTNERGQAGRPDAVVDRRSVLEQEAKLAGDARFAELAEGMVVQGTVRSLTDFGAFLDLDGADALLHISDMSWARVTTPADVVAVGDKLEVKVLKIDASDPQKRRIAVGLKQLQPHPWETVNEQFKIGDKVKGIVTRDADFGAFVELAPGVEGLIHISEMAWGKKVRKPSDIVKTGDQVEVQILSIDTETRRMGLGLKQALGDPFAEIVKTIHPGAVIEGPVSQITKFGAFVTVTEGVEGLVHISEITAEKRLNHPSDVLRVGERVKAQVLEIDSVKRQLRLSIKQMVPTGLDDFLAEHAVGDTVTGRVINLDQAANTARVELGEGIVAPCTLPAPTTPEAPASAANAPLDLSSLSALGSKWKTSHEVIKPGKAVKPSPTPTGEIAAGQVRSFRITALDAATKRLTLDLA